MMQQSLSRVLAIAALTVASASAVAAQTQMAGASSLVGQAAPDFTATATDSTGAAIPVSLSQYKGRVVVLAFYPADRSSGCTVELTKFRDDFATMFGEGTIVLPTSIDSLGSHASWAKEAHFPFALISDTAATVAKQYASASPGRKYFSRTAFVIGKDGTVAYQDLRFDANSQDSYDKLVAAVKAAKEK